MKIKDLDIKKIRKQLQKTQKEFGEMLGVTTRAVQAWESGNRQMSQSAYKLLQSLDSPKTAAPTTPQPPAEQASPIKIPSSQSDARQLAIHVLDHVKELEQQPIFMSYIKQKAYEIALDIVTEKLSK